MYANHFHIVPKGRLFGIIHADVYGSLRHVSRQGASYFITFTDDYSRYGYFYLLKHKNRIFETFKVFKNEMKNQLGKIIKDLQSNRGGEYISQEFKDYLKACGIVQQLTPPYTPQHNGVSEWRNSSLLDMVRSMMNLITLPLFFWKYALKSAKRILNMVLTKKVDKIPYELWYGKVPNLSYLKVCGYEALVKRDTLDKLQQRSIKCIFIGYLKETMGYYFYFPFENKIVVTSEISMEVEGFEPPQEEVILIRRSEKTHRAPNRLCLNVEAEEYSLGDLNEPTSYKAEIKLIFKKKTDMDGIVHTYKHRLVAKGYTQLYEVDYEETFSPVGDIRAIRILISVAAFYDYEIWQMNVKIASLNGYLDEEIYVAQVEGFVDPKYPKKARKTDLNKTQGASTPEVKRMQNVPYASAVGSVMYTVRCTRSDIAFAQNITSHFQQNPGEPYWTAVKNILKYLSNTNDMFFVYGGNPEAELRVDCYRDAGFKTARDDIKSQTGYVFVLNEGAMDWKSSKQSTTVMSAIEAEYIAASEATMEAVWIKKFISGLGIVPTINEPIKMFYDNCAALLIANEAGVQKGARHYHRRYHYVRECNELGKINLLSSHK
nr:hypothetical protein [Tanacetum cinerariifolium]